MRLRAEQIVLNGRDFALSFETFADGSLVAVNQHANVFPALHEIAERCRREQDVEIRDAAPLIGVDQAAAQRVRVKRQRGVCRIQLLLIPGEFAAVTRHLRFERVEVRVDSRDVAIGLRQLRLQGCNVDFRLTELCLLVLKLNVRLMELRLLLRDRVRGVRTCLGRQAQAHRREQRGCGRAGAGGDHARRCRPTENQEAMTPTSAPTPRSVRANWNSLIVAT